MALLSLWEHTGVKTWHVNEMWKRNTLEHIQTQQYKIELERCSSVQTETKLLIARQV